MTKTMNTAKMLLLAAGVAVAMAPAAGFAKGGEGRGPGPRINFETLDADSSGEVTQAEMEAAATARFSAADADGDGYLTKEEISAKAGAKNAKRAEQRVERMFERHDANKDSKLSLTEMAPAEDQAADRFARIDTDNSGGISKAEFEAAKDLRKGRRQQASN